MKNRKLYATRFAESLRAVTGEQEVYACPLCLARFPISDADKLTWDHYPPQSIGRRDSNIVLVCEQCRSKWSVIDAELDTLKKRDLFDEKYPGMIPAKSSVIAQGGEISTKSYLRGAVSFKDRVTFLGTDEVNAPDATKWINQLLERASESEDADSLVLHFESDPSLNYDRTGIELSLLKAAYLAAFDALGYPYILATALETVRKQMHEPRAQVCSGHTVPLPQATEENRYDRQVALAYVCEPEAATSLAVTFRGYELREQYAILLPIPKLGVPLDYSKLRTALVTADKVRWLEFERSPDHITDTELVIVDGMGFQWPLYRSSEQNSHIT